MPLTLGEVTIGSVVEIDRSSFPTPAMLPESTAEGVARHFGWLKPHFFDERTGDIGSRIQTFVVRTPEHVVLIDTCVGNDKPRPARAFWNMMKSDRFERGLAAAGFGVGDIDFVMCTHLHVDHVGWNTRLENGRWVPTFPKARYVFADRELEYWTKRQKDDASTCPWVTDSVLPIVAANRVDIVKSQFAFNDLVNLIPTPGHTIDHYSVHVGKAGADAVVTGDMIHSPLQARYPEIGMMADYDSAQAGRSRRELFGRFCDTSTLMCTAHFPSPSTARIKRWRDAFDFIEA
jgi:glyoxylase-like metal-dependent hydrolase (beta-lactamase superfamily II)